VTQIRFPAKKRNDFVETIPDSSSDIADKSLMTNSRTMDTASSRLSPRQTSSHGLRLVCARSLNQIAEHGDAWNQLTAQSVQGLPMSSYAWTRTHLEHFAVADEQWLVLFAYDGDILVGVLPLCLKRNIEHFGMTVAQCISHENTICADMVTLPGREQECLEFFLDRIHQEIPGIIDIVFPYITDASPTYVLSGEFLSRYKSVSREWGKCAWAQCNRSWTDFQSKLDKDLQKNLRRMHRRLADAGRISVSIVTSDLAEPSHFQRFVRLEHSGWKGSQKTSIGSSGLSLNFFRVLIDRLQDLGWLEWHFMELDGKDIAAQLAFRTGRTLCLVKTAYNETYRRFAPGKLLFEQSLKRGFDSPDIDRVNCLGFGELYHPWNLQTQRFVEVHFIRSGFAGTVFRKIPLQLRTFRRGNGDSQLRLRVRAE
jgi:Acetyltransferase (GNAT) domain